MASETEIEIQSPDGQTKVFLRGKSRSIRIVHRRSDLGVDLDASLELSEESVAYANLQKYFDELTKESPDPITRIRLNDIGLRSQPSLQYLSGVTRNVLSTLLESAEHTNFTYDLAPASRRYLAHTVALITNTTAARVMDLFDEIEGDEAFSRHIREETNKQSERLIAASDGSVKPGRRLGWYAVARLTKPKLIIETGVDKGLGSIVLCAALARNAAEGSPGRYLGTDINPAAGYLLEEPYNQFGEIKYGDSIETLKTVRDDVDIFVNDSDHSAHYEADEYSIIAPHLSEKAVVLGDNAHATDKLADFADKTGRNFLFWREKPVHHWYPGAGIGFAFK